MNKGSSVRIANDLRVWIKAADPGSRLPGSRRLVSDYAASPVTVQKALRTLSAEGLIESRPGVGNFVRAAHSSRPQDYGWQTAALGSPRGSMPSIAGALRTAPPDAHALHSGYPEAALLPERLVRAALVRAARGAAATSRPPAAGIPELRAWFASELAAAPAAGTAPAAGDVVVFPGSQSGLTSVFRALVAPGRPLLIESPTYWGAILAAHQAGVRLVPIPSDADGPDPEALARSFRETGARALYGQPNYANPTGAQWTPDRAETVLDIVRAHQAFFVEDDWARDLGIDTESRPVAARDSSGYVVYLRSLTKSMSPSIRVGAVIARGPARDRIMADHSAESMYVSGLLQHAAVEVLTDPGWQTHRRRLRAQLRERRDLLVDSLGRHAPAIRVEHVPPGGLHLWARLPDTADAGRLVRDCEAAGVYVASGHEWFPAEPSGPYLRLNFTGPDPNGFPAAARIIAAALAAQQDRRD
ncbi:MAG: PLP-dependent aminotransferase family protein [Nocardioides sp.]